MASPIITTADLAEFRAEAEALMQDTCRITKPGVDRGPIDPETMQYTDPEPIVVYEGMCRIPKRENIGGSTSNAGEVTWKVGEYPLSLPVESADYNEEVKVNQAVTYLTAVDPALVGNTYTITEIGDQTHATARRFRMKRGLGS